MNGLFITGTDTGVGKTHVSCVLLEHLKQKGYRVQGMKPVAAGCDPTSTGLQNDDALQLIACSSKAMDYSTVNPYAFESPVAPHLVAEQSGIEMDVELILDSFRRLSAQCDHVIVEGAGGWRVPFNRHQTMADLAVQMQLPVVLVVGIRLGCINHALLTYQSIIDSGLPCLGWVANEIEVDMPLRDENIQSIIERIDAPLMGRLPYNIARSEWTSQAGLLDLSCYTD